MDCSRARKKLNAYLDAELPTAEQADIERHLSSCVPCREALDRLRHVGLIVSGSPVPPLPEKLADRIMASARQRAARRAVPDDAWGLARWWTSCPIPLRIAAAAMLILGVSSGVLMGWDVRHVASKPSSDTRQLARADVTATYNLDYFSPAPNGSLTQTYLNLVSPQKGGEQ